MGTFSYNIDQALNWEETQKLVEILQELTGADFR